MTLALNDKNSKNNNDSSRGYGQGIFLLKVSLLKEYSPECEEIDHQDEFCHQIIWSK